MHVYKYNFRKYLNYEVINLKKKYTTNIDEELLKKAKIKAIQENINLNDLLERLLREYLR